MPASFKLLPAVLVVLSLSLGACNRSTADSDAQPTPAVATEASTAADSQDPCRLLETAEVEAVLGAPLAGPPFRAVSVQGDQAGEPTIDGDVCWYETAGLRSLAVQVIWTDAGRVVAGIGGYLAKAAQGSGGLVTLQDGSELTGEWDEVRMLGCCDFMALRGDSVVDIDFGASTASAEQIGPLADTALRRLDALLPVNGNAGVAAAHQRLARRAPAGDACSLWSASDISELLGEPQGAPERSGESCTYVYLDERNRKQMFMSTVVWRNGYRNYRQENAMLGGIAANLARELGGAKTLTHTDRLDGPWDAAQNSAIQFNSVRNDVQISLRHSKLSLDDIRALMQRAYVNLHLMPESAS
jgi:hypothetical protein